MLCVLAVIIEFPRFFELTDIEIINEETNTTELDWGYTDLFYDPYYQLIYKNIIQLSLKMYLPMVVISYTSLRIAISFQKRNKVLAFKPSRGKQREMKITKTMLAIMVTFIVTQLPVCIYPIARLILPAEKKTLCSPYALYTVAADSVSLVNFLANFFIYMVAWQSFRDRLVASCCCCCRRKKVESEQDNSFTITVQPTTSVTHRDEI